MFSKKQGPSLIFREARDMTSMAFHIEKYEGQPLCRTSNAMYGSREITVEEVLGSVDKQHAGWRWCADCASAFTAQPVELFKVPRT